MNGNDIDFLRQWIGKTENGKDRITAGLVERFRATLADCVELPETDIPLALHWCLAPAAVRESETGADGHAVGGGFSPPVVNARRMWGGGRIEFAAPFQIGDEVTRVSTIQSVEHKVGRKGALIVVGVGHDYLVSGELCVRERQDIVYRLGASNASSGHRTSKPQAAIPAAYRQSVTASTLLMFRYSALTFNGHRIHYDRDYAMQEEGYPGLVFHGPLQATLLANMAAKLEGGRPLKTFAYRGIAPMFGGGKFSLNASQTSEGLDLWTADESGQVCMKAIAEY